MEYRSTNIDITSNTHLMSNRKPLGERTLYSHTVNKKRYFSSLDAEIYFGDTYIDEVVQITWAIEQATMPLFGYNSYVFDDVAVGARQIQGTFVINFTKSGFMYDVLKKVPAVNRSTLSKAEEIDYKVSWNSYYDKEHSAGWDKGFNIRIGYGDQTNKGVNTTLVVLYCVQLTGCQQVIGTDGSPIGESYSFIAKDVRYEANTLPANEPTESKEEGKKEETLVEIKDFVFTIKSSTIEWQKTYMENRFVRPEIYSYNLSYEYKYGEVTGFRLRLKNPNYENISNAYMNIDVGTDGSLTHVINNSYYAGILKAIKDQEVVGADSRGYYLITDLLVYYTQSGIEYCKELKNQKVFIKEINEAPQLPSIIR